jgi:regulator of cell morphogenesis and NO signaling
MATGKTLGTLVPVQQTFAELASELTVHMRKEAMVLFPLIKRLEAAAETGAAVPATPGGSISNPIRIMEFEHDNAGAALAQMRRLTSGYSAPGNWSRRGWRGRGEVPAF